MKNGYKHSQNATVSHLPKTYSDHNPILVKLINPYNNSNWPFRLKNIWCTYPEFPSMVAANWINKDLLDATNAFIKNIIVRGKSTFGSIFKNKKRILARLVGIQNSINYGHNHFLQRSRTIPNKWRRLYPEIWRLLET